MPPPISSSFSALRAYDRPDQKAPQARSDQKSPEKATSSRRLSPALTVQLSVEAQKLMASSGSVQKTSSVSKTANAEIIQSVGEYQNGVGRREAPLNEPASPKTVRPARIGSTLDIKV